MTKQQTKLIDMLIHFHNVCESNGIQYYLISNQLLYAAQNNPIHGYEVEIAMFNSDWINLQHVIESMEDIEIERVTDGGKMPGCYFRYIDKNTLMLDLDYYGVYAKPAIGLNIYIIHSDRIKTKILSRVERIMSYQAAYPDQFGSKVFNSLTRVIGRKRFAKWLENLEVTVRAKSKSGDTVLKEAYGKKCSFPAGFWSTRTEVTFMGHSFYTVSRYQEYLKKRYGANWHEIDPENARQTYRCMFSDCLPYKDYMETIEKEKLLTSDFFKRNKRFQKGYERFKGMLREENIGWDKTMFAAGERFRLWEKYMPMKKQVEHLFSEQRYDEAELILKDYIGVLEKYTDIGIVICFDEEFLEFVKRLYEINGQTEKAEYIDAHVLPEDLLPIEI